MASADKKYTGFKLVVLLIVIVCILDFGIHILRNDLNTRNKAGYSQPVSINYTGNLGQRTFSLPGLLSFVYPANFSIMYDQQQHVVVITTPFIKALASPVQMTITSVLLNQGESLLSFINTNPPCTVANLRPPIPAYINDSIQGMVLLDVPCIPYPQTRVYTINNGAVVMMTIAANGTFGEIKPFIASILSSLTL